MIFVELISVSKNETCETLVNKEVELQKNKGTIKKVIQKMYEIVFYSDYNDDYIIKQKFNSEAEAKEWADGLEYDFTDIAIDEDGNDYWKTFYRYYNPENKENNYTGYYVQKCIK